MPGQSLPQFNDWYDSVIDVGAPGNRAFFGRNVLDGLVQGIRDFRAHAQERWKQYGGSGTTLLGCAMWMDDPELIDELATLEAACVVVSKQPRGSEHATRGLQRLVDLNARTTGLPVEHFPRLEQLTRLVDGQPPLIGPGWTLPESDAYIPTVRSIGFRKGGSNGKMPPVLHAKIALLGRLWYHDEDEYGFFADYTAFAAKRLWIGSCNFTSSSRRSLEFGFWTEDPVLLKGAEEFLIRLIADSEDIDADADNHQPERGLPDYDDEAMAEWAAETRFAELVDEDL
jgi:hypothetical protein